MSIDQLPSGNYRARVMIAGQRHTATFPTRPDAEQWLALTRTRAATGDLPPPITVEQYATRWLDTPDTLAVQDRNRYRLHLEEHILPRLGRCQLADIIPTDIALLRNHVTRTTTAQIGQEVHRTCAALFDAALADGLLARSPVRPPPAASAPPPRSF